jgi:magnesium-transporting ATPase (P-type)
MIEFKWIRRTVGSLVFGFIALAVGALLVGGGSQAAWSQFLYYSRTGISRPLFPDFTFGKLFFVYILTSVIIFFLLTYFESDFAKRHKITIRSKIAVFLVHWLVYTAIIGYLMTIMRYATGQALINPNAPYLYDQYIWLVLIITLGIVAAYVTFKKH